MIGGVVGNDFWGGGTKMGGVRGGGWNRRELKVA